MEEMKKNVILKYGAYFHMLDSPEFPSIEPGKISYMIYLSDDADNSDLNDLRKFVHIYSISYRMVLIDDQKYKTCYLLEGEQSEKEELDSVMKWLIKIHPRWKIIDCQEDTGIPYIVGYRVANNKFQAKRLELQGEIVEL